MLARYILKATTTVYILWQSALNAFRPFLSISIFLQCSFSRTMKCLNFKWVLKQRTMQKMKKRLLNHRYLPFLNLSLICTKICKNFKNTKKNTKNILEPIYRYLAKKFKILQTRIIFVVEKSII